MGNTKPGYWHDVTCPECTEEMTLRTNDILPPKLVDCYDHMEVDELIACARKLEERRYALAVEVGELRSGNKTLRAENARLTLEVQKQLREKMDFLKSMEEATRPQEAQG